MVRPLGTIRNLATTIAQLNVTGLSYLVKQIESEAGKSPKIITHTFATEKMASRAQRLLYQWLWFFPDLKSLVSIRVDNTILQIKLTKTPERRGRKGRKLV